MMSFKSKKKKIFSVNEGISLDNINVFKHASRCRNLNVTGSFAVFVKYLYFQSSASTLQSADSAGLRFLAHQQLKPVLCRAYSTWVQVVFLHTFAYQCCFALSCRGKRRSWSWRTCVLKTMPTTAASLLSGTCAGSPTAVSSSSSPTKQVQGCSVLQKTLLPQNEKPYMVPFVLCSLAVH